MNTPGAKQDPDYIRAAHYFADGWPLDSLLVMRQPLLRRDLRRLRRSGFNTIILVVPWRGFQSSQKPVAYDDVYRRQLILVLDEARSQGLGVILRVAYVHQILPGPSTGPIRTTQAMLMDPDLRGAWLDYFRELRELIDVSGGCRGMFLSWEELWHAYIHFQSQTPAERRRAAAVLGFNGFLDELGEGGSGLIPEAGGAGSLLYHRFVNQHMADLFRQARDVCPALGVEYRVDRDVLEENGETCWLENERFLEWEPARYSYWAPFMYATNAGETIDAERALVSLGTMLDETTQGGAFNGQVLEQFNFIENTRQYQGTHAQIANEAIGEFLEGAAPLLRARSRGYGIWAPRDYRCNVLYNAAFLDNARGWELDGLSVATSGAVQLPGESMLVQTLHPRVAWIPRMHAFESLRLELSCSWSLLPRRRRLRARLNGGPWAELQVEGRRLLIADVPIDFDSIPEQGLHFELENRGATVTIARVQLYHMSYAMGLRDCDGRPGPYLGAVEAFNKRLAEPVCADDASP